MNHKDKILALELKTVALRKVTDETVQELANLKKQTEMPAPTVRRKNKIVRLQSFADFYTKRKIR